MSSSDNSSSSTNIEINNSVPEQETLPILNMTNVTINTTKITFVYYDHNTSTFNGCYGLNYTVLGDSEGNKYMLDHATTDILGEKTNYTFKYPNGIGLIYDNNTETEIYNNTGLYYIHEVTDDNGTVIKSLGNFTLNDQSHQPDIIPDKWLFVYRDHNSTTYDGDEGLIEAITHNTIGNKEELHFGLDEDIIGLAYFADKDFNFYKYGLSGVNTRNNSNGDYCSAWGSQLRLPNGTLIRTFSIEDYGLTQKEKNFITNYENRIDEVRHKQQIDAIYDAEDQYYTDSIRYHENNKKSDYSYYVGTNGYGIIHNL